MRPVARRVCVGAATWHGALSNDAREVRSKTTTATCESRMYDGMSERKRSCPAVSHSCSRTVPSSTGTVLLTKSIPMVVCARRESERM